MIKLNEADEISRFRVLHKMAEERSSAGDTSGAKQTLRHALQAAVANPNLGREFLLLWRSAVGQAEVGDIPGALGAAAAITGRGRQVDVMSAIARDQAKAVAIALIAAERVDSGDLGGALAWAAAHAADPVAKVNALVGAAADLLQPAERPGLRSVAELVPRNLRLF